MYGKYNIRDKRGRFISLSKNTEDKFDRAVKQNTNLSYEKKKELFFQYIGKTSEDIEKQKLKKVNTGRKIYLIISDPHLPYLDLEALANVLEKEKHRIDEIIIAGDVWDLESLSSHRKFKNKTLQEELAESRLILEWLASFGIPIKITMGNHDHGRYIRVIAKEIPQDLQFLLVDPFEQILSGLDIKRVSTEIKGVTDIPWFYVVGKDAIVGHCEKTGPQLKNAEDFYNWLEKWKKVIGISDIRFVATGHTHKGGALFKKDLIIVDTGSFVSLEGVEYALHDAKAIFTPSVMSYTILVQDLEGNTVLEECEFKYVG